MAQAGIKLATQVNEADMRPNRSTLFLFSPLDNDFFFFGLLTQTLINSDLKLGKSRSAFSYFVSCIYLSS